jgi:alpha-galactosidase
MAFKIAFIGAGSIGFTRGLLRDVLSVPEFADIEVAFTDMSKTNLDMVTKLCQRDIDENGLKIKIKATTDRREAFTGARYIFSVVRIGGLDAFKMDVDIPLKYGVDQCVGDTLCAGGIMYGQRGIQAMLDFCKDIREVAEPNALLINYANPMAQMTWAANKFGGVRCVGLCHGVQHGHGQLVEVIKLLVNGDRKEGDPGYGPAYTLEVWKASVATEAVIGLINATTEFGSFDLKFTMLADETNHPGNEFFQMLYTDSLTKPAP